MFPGGCYADKGCLPEMEENTEDQVIPRLNKRDLRFLYGWAPAHKKIFGQNGIYLNICITCLPLRLLKLFFGEINAEYYLPF